MNQNYFSSECRDLLSRCLVRCPEKRIDFSDFFSHPFLDLEHLPDENSFQKASLLVTQVVNQLFKCTQHVTLTYQ